MMILAQRNNSTLMKNRYKLLVLTFFSISLFSSLTENISAQEEILPLWLKTTALWWGQDKIGDQDFISALQYLVENNVLTLESEIQSKPLAKLKPIPKDLIVWPKIDRIEDFKVQGHKNTDLYHLQFKLIDINKNPVTPDGTISVVIMDDKNRILYLDAFSIRKSSYEKSFEAFGESGDGKNVFAWEIKTSDIKPGFTEYGKAKLMFTDRYGNNIESEFVQISIPQFN